MNTSKVKRSYNLRPGTVQLVKRLVEERVAPSQDALVERAIRSLARRIRDDLFARQYAEAALDPEFVREFEEWERGLASDDQLAWE